MMADPLGDLSEALMRAGQPVEDLIPDGQLHRYDGDGKRGRKPCWYVVHTLSSGHVVGVFGDNRLGTDYKVKWRSWEHNGHAALSAEERKRFEQEAERLNRAREEATAKTHAKAAQDAKDEWGRCLPTGQSEYLMRKRIGAHGIRFGRDDDRGDYLAIPMRAGAKWRGIQRIYDDGTKRFTAGCEKKGAYALLGTLTERGPVYICEGYATGATIHEATGQLVVVAFDAGNIPPVIESLIKTYRARLVVCADNDLWSSQKIGNTGAKLAEEVRYRFNLRTILPNFEGWETKDKPTDFNDLLTVAGLPEVVSQLGVFRGGQEELSAPPAVPKIQSLIITEEEYEQAKITPRCIVEHYLYADTALLLAAGGTGKTTLQLYEAVHIVLGLPLYGFKISSPGTVLIVTAEDSRELLIARLRRIVVALGLSEVQRRAVQHGIRILDLSAQISRLVISDHGNNLQLTPLVDSIIEACKGDEPVLTVFDPAISFGAGESRVNDNEQALITASRRIVRSLDCCVRYAHHLGKEAARNKMMDQYAGRSGSALPDGSRMVVVLQPWGENDKLDASPPAIFQATDDSQIMLLNRPKLSYEPPQALMWIQRRDYVYECALDMPMNSESQISQNADQIERFLESELVSKRYHTKATVEGKRNTLGMSRDAVREALTELEVSGRIVKQKRPGAEQQKRGSRDYLMPAKDAAHYA